MDAMQQLVDHVRYRIGTRSQHAGKERCDELVRLVVAHWPHRHLEAAMLHGRTAKAIDHAMVLLKAQVREQWEARHGIGPAWALLMAPAMHAIAQVLLDLWCSDPGWAQRLEQMGQDIRTGGRS